MAHETPNETESIDDMADQLNDQGRLTDHRGIPMGLGEGDVTIDIDADTARQLWHAYQLTAEAGADVRWYTFVYNHTAGETDVTVDGQDFAVWLAEEGGDPDALDP